MPIKDRKVIFEQIQNENVQTKDDEKNRGGKFQFWQYLWIRKPY